MFKGNKKSFIISIALIGAIIFSAIAVLIVNLIENKNSEQAPIVEAAYDFANGALTSDDYVYYKISSLTALKNFQTSVNTNGLSFEGCIVQLDADIDCEGNSIGIGYGSYERTGTLAGLKGGYESDVTNFFKGTFDGKGYTIKNFALGIKLTCYLGSSATNDPDYYYRGLFLTTNGTLIENVKFSEIKYVFNSSDQGYWGLLENDNKTVMVGLILGEGTIQNCVMENISYDESEADYCLSYTGAFGINSNYNFLFDDVNTIKHTEILNCLLLNAPTLSSDVESFVFGGNPSKCVSYIDTTSCSDGVISIFTNSEKDSNSCYSAISTNFEGLNPSVYGGKRSSVSVNDYWYYVQEYRDWPMLRDFVDWTVYRFGTNPSAYGDVNYTILRIPSDASVSITESQLKVDTLIILGISIKATPTDTTLYRFKEWKVQGTAGVTYNAYFELVLYTVTFTKSPTNMSMTSGEETYTVNAKTKITASFDKSTNIITYTFGDNSVTYTIDSTYTLETYGTESNATEIEVRSNVTITPTAKLKTYTPSFG